MPEQEIKINMEEEPAREKVRDVHVKVESDEKEPAPVPEPKEILFKVEE